MTNELNVSNWTMATGTKPGERYVYRDTPPSLATHSTAETLSRVEEDRSMTRRSLDDASTFMAAA